MLVIGAFLTLSAYVPRELILGQSTVLTVLLNGTHFMASYRLLYASRAFALRYPAASIYVPAGLALYCVLTLWSLTWSPPDTRFLQALLVVGALYLALHYTGQAWGMMSSFAFLEGLRFSPAERRAFRVSLKVLALWQMVWSLTLLQDPPAWLSRSLPPLMQLLNVLAGVTAGVGVVVFARITARIGRVPSIRVMVPYFLLHIWYLFLWVHPQALFWVQLSHALQYLSFPVRVELNRLSASGDLASHIGSILVRLLLASATVFFVIKTGITYNNPGFETYWVVIASFINIHHYFIDGCIWKISSPVVKDEVFAHIRKA